MKYVKIIKKEKIVINRLKYCNNHEYSPVKTNGNNNLFLNRYKNAAVTIIMV